MYRFGLILGCFVLGVALSLPSSANNESLRDLGIWPSDLEYQSSYPVTRATYLEMLLYTKDGGIRPEDLNPYLDVPSGHPDARVVTQGWQDGVISQANPWFWPERAISRQDAMLWLVESLSEPPVRSLQYAALEGITDLPDGPDAQRAIAYGIDQGLIMPRSESQYAPERILTQEEAVSILLHLQQERAHLNRRQYDFPGIENQQAAWDVIQSYYIEPGEVDEDTITEASLRAMLEAIGDPYTNYLSEAEVSSLLSSLGVDTSNIGGLGVVLEYDEEEKAYRILRVLENSGADNAGIEVGDLITHVNGTAVAEIDEGVSVFLGEIGTTLEVTYRRGQVSRTVTVTRSSLVTSPVESRVHRGYLVISISTFGSGIGAMVQNALEAESEAAQRGVLLDLRNNPGGFTDSAAEVAALFLPGNRNIYSLEGRYVTHNERTQSNGGWHEVPLYVLMNEHSASASEILAAALRENRRAPLYGAKSFGKERGQQLFYLPQGGALKVSTSRWLTPTRDTISENGGILPDVEIPAEILADQQEGQEYVIELIQNGNVPNLEPNQ